MKKLGKKVKAKSTADPYPSHHEYLLKDYNEDEESSVITTTTPTGCFAVYVGEERQRFVVPTGYLPHPLFKMLLEKAYNEFGFDQKRGLALPFSVTAFQEIMTAIECCNGKFNFGNLVDEFINEEN
ncbi:hypothetical protein RD792_005682 [Penstemon davidsonii]|uniref:Uncharacterized protein n=1 Tax=Penstemon davidsonii TaxID=160366 RepID=A0ABR0DFC4_9LAMI|nr:hypothetical protein RD792_005682 [Penstemon davidsonii]